jgi:hypothetical protein
VQSDKLRNSGDHRGNKSYELGKSRSLKIGCWRLAQIERIEPRNQEKLKVEKKPARPVMERKK